MEGGGAFNSEFKGKICENVLQSKIYERILGGMVKFEFKNAYKLLEVAQPKIVAILRIEVLISQVHMNHEYFEALIVDSTFEKFPKETQESLSSIMPTLVETVIIREAMAVEGTTLEVAMEVEGVSQEVVSIKVPVDVTK